jgi:hypothetical protein
MPTASVELATLFSTKLQMSVNDLSAAIGQELPYRTVPGVEATARGKSRVDPTGQSILYEHQSHCWWLMESARWRPPPRMPQSYLS